MNISERVSGVMISSAYTNRRIFHVAFNVTADLLSAVKLNETKKSVLKIFHRIRDESAAMRRGPTKILCNRKITSKSRKQNAEGNPADRSAGHSEVIGLSEGFGGMLRLRSASLDSDDNGNR